MCRPGTRTGSRRLAAPAPPLRSTQGVCSDPSESRVGFYKGTCTSAYQHWSDRSIFGAQLGAVDRRPLAPGRPLQQGTFTLSICASCVCVCLVFKRWESFTILNQGCLSRSKNRKELSGRRSRPQVLLEKSRYQGNHWIHLSFTRFEKKLAD